METASRNTSDLNNKLKQLFLSHPELASIQKSPSPKNRKRNQQNKVQSPSYSSLSSDESDSEPTIVRGNSLSPTSDLDTTKGSLLEACLLRGTSLPPSQIKKRVSFADCSGKVLRRIRVISENRDDPPSFLVNRAKKEKAKSLSHLPRGSQCSDGSSGFGESFESSGHSDDDGMYQILPNSQTKGFTQKDLSGLANFINRLQGDHISSSSPQRCSSLPISLKQSTPKKSSELRSSSATSISTVQDRIKLKSSPKCKFQPCFVQPAQNTQLLLTKLNESMVSLERATMNSANFRGTIVVKNIDYSKKVSVRYTTDGWKTTHDRPAFWRKSNLDQSIDTFEFAVTIFDEANVDKVQFCIKFLANNKEYWDSNSGQNYAFQQVKMEKVFFG